MSFSDIYGFLTKKVLPIGVLFLVASFFYLNLYNSIHYPLNLNSDEEEIESNTSRDIISTRGRLNVNGWCRNPDKLNIIPDYVRATTSVLKEINIFRYKRWERYTFTSKYITFSIMVFDYQYAGGYHIWYSDIRDKDKGIRRYSATNLLEKPNMADNCTEKCYQVKFKIEDSTQALKKCEFYKFHRNQHKIRFFFEDKGLDLEVELTASTKKPTADALVNISPIIQDTSLFVMNHNTNLMGAKGKLTINKKPMQAQVFHVTHSSVSGVFPLRLKWMWMTANGQTTSRKNKIGLNFGYGMGHPSSKSTESAFNIDGTIHKLKGIQIDLPDNFYQNYFDETDESKIKIHNINTESETKCDIAFKPVKKLIDTHRFYYTAFFQSNVSHGVFSGFCTDKNGVKYEFESIYGVVELKNNFF